MITLLLILLLDLDVCQLFSSCAYDVLFVAIKPKDRRVETVVDTRCSPTELAHPDTSWMMPNFLYSALMGLLINPGAAFIGAGHVGYYPNQHRLRFTNVNIEYLLFLQAYFGDYFRYGAGLTTRGVNVKSIALQTMNSPLVDHLFDVWHANYYSPILPAHFEQLFNWTTLAFWIMRSGHINGSSIRIGVATLCLEDKLRVISVLQAKLGLTAVLVMNNSALSIRDYPSWVHHVKPMIHETQEYRLVKKPRPKSS